MMPLVLGFALAYANGANGVSKGVATLAGAGVASYRQGPFFGAPSGPEREG